MHERTPMKHTLFSALALLFAVFATSSTAQSRAGEFDHYVLALSWVPAYCAADGDERRDPRCRDGSGIGWAVHGLWPQHAGGRWPEYCQSPHRDPSRRETRDQAGLFGTSGSAWHQWNKHGTCTGLNARNFYALVQEAVNSVTLPEIFEGITRELSVDPDVIEAAFIEDNPDLTHDMLVTSCRRGDLVELRICMTRSLEPRRCDRAMLRRECNLSGADLLPLR